MCDKNEIRIVLFFEISSDQRFFFRLQIVWVADLTFVFLSHQLFCFVKTYSRDLVYFRKFHFQNGKFMSVVFLQKLDCILTLGGNGTHKTANLLSEEGLNIIGLPKTIDNDIWGTDVTFGFHTAVDIATEVVDRIHTTATSHRRIMVIEIMGNKAGWLTLYSGIAGGADIILIPEIPYDIDKVIDACEKRAQSGKTFSIIAVAEGAMDIAEAAMKKKERAKKRAEAGETTVTNRIAKQIEAATGFESRTVVPGHILRGGSPSAYDRVLATKFGARAAMLIKQEKYGYTVAKIGSKISENKLSDVTMKTKFVSENDELVITGKSIGVSFGD